MGLGAEKHAGPARENRAGPALFSGADDRIRTGDLNNRFTVVEHLERPDPVVQCAPLSETTLTFDAR